MRKLIPALLVAALLVGTAAPALANSGGHLEGYVPAVAHVEGKFDAFWTTDVWVYQQGATVIHLWLNAPGQDNTDGESVVVPLDESAVFLPDVVASIFGTEGSGSLHYLADGPVTVTSRTWTPGVEGGSYGLSLPGRPTRTPTSVPTTGWSTCLRSRPRYWWRFSPPTASRPLATTPRSRSIWSRSV